MYHLHMHRWLEVFPREQLLVVNGDQLIEDPVSQLHRIETFLGKFSDQPQKQMQIVKVSAQDKHILKLTVV